MKVKFVWGLMRRVGIIAFLYIPEQLLHTIKSPANSLSAGWHLFEQTHVQSGKLQDQARHNLYVELRCPDPDSSV
jgi:hypothetical protein